MTANRKGDSLKSALDLALERLAQKEGPAPALTAEQKRALAEVDARLQADLAQAEIMSRHELQKALAAGDLEGAEKLRERQQAERAALRRRAAEEKQAVRAGSRQP